MRHVATPRCLCRCVCSRCTLAADAAEASKHQGGGRTAARAFARSARAARHSRRRVAQEATPRFEQRRTRPLHGSAFDTSRLDAASRARWLPALRFVSGEPHARTAGCGSSFIVRVGAHRPVTRASMNPAPPERARQSARGGCAARVRTGTCRSCPPSSCGAPSATPALHREELLDVAQLVLAQAPRERVNRCRERG